MKKKAVIISSILLVVFVVLTILMVTGLTKEFDLAIYNLVRGLSCDFFDYFFVFITNFGDESTIIILVIILLFILKNNYRMMVLMMTIVSTISNQVIKFIIRRPRPEVLKLIEQGGYSYPSGHSMICVALYGLFLYFVVVNIKNKYLKYGLCSLLVLLIVSVGISRIYVGVHYASDVLGGFILSTAELILFVNYTRMHNRGNQNV